MVYVLICGEQLRRDDGAAVVAARLLPRDAVALARLSEIGQLSLEALLDAPADEAVIVADSAVGIPAGTVVVLPLQAVARSMGSGANPASSHALPPDQLLALADEMRGTQLRGAFVGIGGADFGFGEGLSDAVAAALPEFATAIASEIRRLAAG